MSTADRALVDRSLTTFALNTYEFTRCTKYVFADGSFLLVHASGRAEANTINV